MTRIEYELLREQEPQLGFPAWPELPFVKIDSPFCQRVTNCTREQLIALRTAYILRGRHKSWILYDPQEMEPPATATA
jgi:hypothetical protein